MCLFPLPEGFFPAERTARGGTMEKKTDRQMPAGELLKRFAPYFIKYKGMLLFDLFCAALTTVCEIVFPLIVRAVTNRAMISPEEITVPWVLMLGLLYLALRVIDAAGIDRLVPVAMKR